VTYVRVTRDHRGYETTFLLHSARPGAPPRILYWYRTAPGVRVGRPALDEDAIRTIEDQHPDIEFDWPQLLEEASVTPPDVERRPERRRRSRPADEPVEFAADTSPVITAAEPAAAATPRDSNATLPPSAERSMPIVEASRNQLLDQLVGREIASRLRARYREITVRIAEARPDDERLSVWRSRAEALDPDRWLTPHDILHGVEHADRLFDELRRDVVGTE
jgi:hypothetical protein